MQPCPDIGTSHDLSRDGRRVRVVASNCAYRMNAKDEVTRFATWPRGLAACADLHCRAQYRMPNPKTRAASMRTQEASSKRSRICPRRRRESPRKFSGSDRQSLLSVTTGGRRSGTSCVVSQFDRDGRYLV